MLIEGLISIASFQAFPAFEISHVNIRFSPENKKEEELIKKGKISSHIGDVGKARPPIIETIGDIYRILKYMDNSQKMLSTLSIITIALRAEEKYEMELAFIMYFRIFEGYFSDGRRNIEAGLKKQAKEIEARLEPDIELTSSLKKVLTKLSLPTRSDKSLDINNIIYDLVQIRHKLVHYNLKNHDRHFFSSLRFDIEPIIFKLKKCVLVLVRNDIGME